MKTKEYVKKYNLNEDDQFNHSEFAEDLTNDFLALLEMNQAVNNIKGFEHSVKQIRTKIDSINNKTVGCIDEKLWNFFYASVVVKLREELCPAEMERRKKTKEAYEERVKQFEEERKQEEDFFDRFFRRSLLLDFFKKNIKLPPINDFNVLGLTLKDSTEDVKAAYRKLSLRCHPDRGGNQEEFIRLTTSKNKCLSWLEQEVNQTVNN